MNRGKPTWPARAYRLLGLVWLLPYLWTAAAASGQDAPASEYKVEAAFLYHFANFVSWPPAVFPDANTPINIGVLGEDPLSDELESTVRHKTVNGRALQIIHLDLKALAQAKRCQIVFISASERKHLPEIFEALTGASVLTVGKMEGFIQRGGIINFVIDDKKVRFEINDAAAKRAGVKVSAKLLNLSKNKGIT